MSQDYSLEEGQSIVRVSSLRGGNICEVELPNGEKVLSLIPTKFLNVLWIKNGNYAIIDGIEDKAYASKVRTSIVQILSSDQAKEWEKLDVWPKEFLSEEKNHDANNGTTNKKEKGDDDDSEEDNDDDLFVNPNHVVDEEEEGEEEEEEEENE